MEPLRVLVYASSSKATPDRYLKAAAELGRAISKKVSSQAERHTHMCNCCPSGVMLAAMRGVLCVHTAVS